MSDANDSMDEAIRYAKKYLEDLLSFFGLNTDVHATSDDEVIQLGVPSTHLNGFLIGHNGENMRSLQFLVGTALKNNNFAYNRVNVDIADYKKQRADRLRERAEDWVKQVKSSGQPMDLQPMNAADRRVVHQLAGEHGLSTQSVGEGRDRHIVLGPSSDDQQSSERSPELDSGSTQSGDQQAEEISPESEAGPEPAEPPAEEE